MRTLVIAVALCALPCALPAQNGVSAEEHQSIVRQSNERAEQLDRALADLRTARLHQAALAVQVASTGRSHLLLGAGVSANPQLGRVLRMDAWGSAPLITVYPVTSPRVVKLPGVGECQIVGALDMLTGAHAHGERAGCDAGLYLAALRSPAGAAPAVSLLSATIDARGEVAYRPALTAPAKLLPGSPLATRAAFPGPAEASKVRPAWQVQVDLPAAQGSVRFILDMNITML